NDVLLKNPTRKVEVPNCKAPKETRTLTVDEVTRLWNALEGQEYLIFRIMILCGPRPNECFAVKRDDYTGDVLRIDESVSRVSSGGRFGPTKNHKTRYAPVPASLKAELDVWLASRPPEPEALLFTAPRSGPIR